MKRLLIVTAVDAEAQAIGHLADCEKVAGGIGRVNAAATTTEWLIRHGPYDGVISAGVAGAARDSGLSIGDAVAASCCVYAEEGLIGPGGFSDMAAMGFALGDFTGNVVPVDEAMLDAAGECMMIGPIATVATCSGTDEAAATIAGRTGAVAEAMEGAAVVHAARRLRVPAIEIRTISNTTGDRTQQQWNLDAALAQIGPTLRAYVKHLRNG